jgi:cation transport ATPase
MDNDDKKIKETTTKTDNMVEHTTQVHDPEQQDTHSRNVATRVIWYIAGILLVLLAIRFVLTLLGANESNGFASFIYIVTFPFVAPFFGLFNYEIEYGVSRFEIFTLVAMAVYALVAYGIAQLFNLGRREM